MWFPIYCSHYISPIVPLPVLCYVLHPVSLRPCPNHCVKLKVSHTLCPIHYIPLITLSNPLCPSTISHPPPSQSAYNILSPLVPRSLRPKLINFDYIFNPCDILSIILDSPQSPCDISSDTSPQCFRARTTFPVPPASIHLIRYNRTTMS